ncbi:hypothetical protein M0813_23463 [Anaeramoeba flamelloides]|uniref:Importin N-terminal domain-containing protein n=1 Tax=Anaeramoeba flamelloides TaxID=1746091 RepID=A0ABQ8Y8Y7_9EUKA|nr:hypothetical protein M0813_23463 [Anaeramoeba flamelloides]
MSVEWKPIERVCSEILELLNQSFVFDNNVQSQVLIQLEKFNNSLEDFNNYLAFLLCRSLGQELKVRQMAGLILKNNLMQIIESKNQIYLEMLKKELVNGIPDENKIIRTTVNCVISQILSKSGFHSWPELYEILIDFLTSENELAIEGSLECILTFCEDNGADQETDLCDSNLDELLPVILKFFQSKVVKYRMYAIKIYYELLLPMPTSLISTLTDYLKGLFYLIDDSELVIHIELVKTFSLLISIRIDYMLQYLDQIIPYIIKTMKENDHQLVLEACNFWKYCSFKSCKKCFKEDEIRELIEILLERMILSKFDRSVFENEQKLQSLIENDPNIDRDTLHKYYSYSKSLNGFDDVSSSGSEDDDDDDYDSIENSDSENENSEYENSEVFNKNKGEWNIRDSAAEGFERIAKIFKNDFLLYFFPLMKDRLISKDPYVREVVIYALGQIAKPTSEAMLEHLPEIIPYFLQIINEEDELILKRKSLWALGKYSKNIIELVYNLIDTENEENAKELLLNVFQCFLNLMVDENQLLQRSAINGFTKFIRAIGDKGISEHLLPILENISIASEKYSKRNLLLLYDLCGTIAEIVQEELNTKKDYSDLMLQVLFKKWQDIEDDDPHLLAIFDNLNVIIPQITSFITPYCETIFKRCVNIIETTVLGYYAIENSDNNNNNNVNLENFEKSLPPKIIMVFAIEVLSNLYDVMKEELSPLFLQTKIIEMIPYLIQDIDSDVREVSFGLLGSITKYSFDLINQDINELLPLLINQINLDYSSVCNNAIWTLSEIIIQTPESIEPFSEPILEKLIKIIKILSLEKNLLENCAIALNFMGLHYPEITSIHLNIFFSNLCFVMKLIKRERDKDLAYRGLCNLIQKNPQVLLDRFPHFLEAICYYNNPKKDLSEVFLMFINEYKETKKENWIEEFESLPLKIQQFLKDKYNNY